MNPAHVIVSFSLIVLQVDLKSMSVSKTEERKVAFYTPQLG